MSVPANFATRPHYPGEVKAVWVTAALLGLCAEAAAAPLSQEIRIADTNPGMSENIATDLDFPLCLIEDAFFHESPGDYQPTPLESDLGDDLPDSDILAQTLAGDTYLRAPEPPAAVLVVIGLVFLGIFEVLRRRMARRIQRLKTRGRRRRVRIDLRMMS